MDYSDSKYDRYRNTHYAPTQERINMIARAARDAGMDRESVETCVSIQVNYSKEMIAEAIERAYVKGE